MIKIFLRALANLRNASINSVISICPSVLPSIRIEQLRLLWTDFDEVWNLSFFRKCVKNVLQISLKSDKNNRYFTWRPIYIYDTIFLNYF
jgi:hypothetical protein